MGTLGLSVNGQKLMQEGLPTTSKFQSLDTTILGLAGRVEPVAQGQTVKPGKIC